ncbi:MAG: DMT family transporter [Gammaproteobacteria bacterium]|nr:DMT family transporter [Gammaproteobacteria bacterium]
MNNNIFSHHKISRFTEQYKVPICASLALLAFAGNSILCRLALGQNTIDAASFTIIRLLSGSLMLALLLLFTRGNRAQLKTGVDTNISTNTSSTHTSSAKSKGSWLAALMLFVYATAFSYGYISLDTGTGALILFGAVQLTMILFSVFSGQKLQLGQWAGLVCAFAGFIYLVADSLATPSLLGFMLMTISGIGWAIYTLLGKGSSNPLADTSYNFILTTPLVLLLLLWLYPAGYWSVNGVLLAVISGTLTSGLGYALWYVALGGLAITQAAVIQLLVPIIAAIGGVIFAGEALSLRLVISSLLVLGGIALVIFAKKSEASTRKVS